MDTTPELERFLSRVSLFTVLRPEELRALAAGLATEQLPSGRILFREGDPGGALWVLDGEVEVTLSSLDPQTRRPRALAYARGGDTVGEMALIDGGRRSGTALVVQGGPAYRLDAAAFAHLRQQAPAAAYAILRSLCRTLCGRLRATSDRIVSPNPAPPRVTELPTPRRPTAEELDGFPTLAQLPAVVKLALTQKLELLDVPGVHPLFSEGDSADAAYFILEGEVTVARNGRTLATLGLGKMFGLVAAIDGGVRSASCLTSGPARLLRLRDRDFDALFSAGNRFAYGLLDLVSRQLVEHLREANRLLPLAGQVTAFKEEDFLPEAEILPLELEVEVDPRPDVPEGLSGSVAH